MIQYFPAGTVDAPANVFEGIKVVSATYLKPAERSKKADGNVTKKAAEFLNGNWEIEYKVSSKFLGMPYEAGREFELKWVCPKNPKDVQVTKVDAPAENKRFTVKCEE
ncbi:hypothetical protein D3C72_2089900 [compost metagenome]